jgi:hypothetical protein
MVSDGRPLGYDVDMVASPVNPDDFDLEHVEATKLMTVEEKLLVGPQLFDLAVESIRAGLEASHRAGNPALLVSDEALDEIIRQRFALAARLDESD